jgi:hypothetical protein
MFAQIKNFEQNIDVPLQLFNIKNENFEFDQYLIGSLDPSCRFFE